MNGDKFSYILGRILGFVMMSCLAALGVAVTVKMIFWLFNI